LGKVIAVVAADCHIRLIWQAGFTGGYLLFDSIEQRSKVTPTSCGLIRILFVV
jgi:hypothetical protein